MAFFDFLSKAQSTEIQELQKRQNALQTSYEGDQANFLAVKIKFAKSKRDLVNFNNQYGPVLQLMAEE